MHDLLKRYGNGLAAVIILLTVFWLLILLILPNITMFESSFRPYLPVTEVGGRRTPIRSTTICASLVATCPCRSLVLT